MPRKSSKISTSSTISKEITKVTTGKTVKKFHVFEPFRAIGYVSNDVPLAIQSRGQKYFFTSCIGNAFHVYNVDQMRLLFVSPPTNLPITSIATSGDVTYVATGNSILVYIRARLIKEWSCTAKISNITLLGNFLLSICDDNAVRIWNIEEGEVETVLEFPSDFTVTTLLHPSTYLNKILVGSSQGGLQLWNIRRNALIHSFASLSSPITCLVQSPVIDVVAIGCLDGTIVIHNIRYDETIMKLKQDAKVTAMSFRSDGTSTLATANMYGDICLWDLEKKLLFYVLKGAHDGPIATCYFFNGQPLLLTSGADNSVKQWIFDTLDGLPRLLKSRTGHHASPTHLTYFNQESILSAARDRSLRMFSVIKDARSTELSQGSLGKKAKKLSQKIDQLKLSPITAMASNDARQRDWDNIITGHANDAVARTWLTKTMALGTHQLVTSDKTPVKAVAISHCGNFGMIGSSGGLIDMFNLQSGLLRKTFGKGQERHSKAITGIVSDNTNRFLITSSLDGTIRFWDFHTGHALYTLSLPSPPTLIRYHDSSQLLAIACDDLVIRVLDIDTRKTVREFSGHLNRITDYCFSPDARWIVSASLDGTIRTWDLPTGFCVDAFKVEYLVTSLTFSPSGDFLATAHVDNVGIFLWSNKVLFGNVELKKIEEGEVDALLMPTAAEPVEMLEEEELVQDLMQVELNEPIDLSDELISLSNLPRSRWQTLLNLDTIRKRNKPKEAPKAPEKAPFFLPSLSGTKKVNGPEVKENGSKIVRTHDFSGDTAFLQKLHACHGEEDFTYFFEHVKTLSPAALDFELQNLTAYNEMRDMVAFVDALIWCLESKKNFEMCESLLNAFLKIHGDVLEDAPKVRLSHLLQLHKDTWKRLDEQFQYGLCLVDFIRLKQ